MARATGGQFLQAEWLVSVGQLGRTSTCRGGLRWLTAAAGAETHRHWCVGNGCAELAALESMAAEESCRPTAGLPEALAAAGSGPSLAHVCNLASWARGMGFPGH